MKGESLFALLAGAAAGLTLGLLFAPESGEKTREKVRARARLARIDLKDLKETIKEQGADLKEDARAKILEQLEKLETSLRKEEECAVDEQCSETL